METPSDFFTMLNDGEGNFTFLRKKYVEAISVAKISDTYYTVKFHMYSGAIQIYKLKINEYHNEKDGYVEVERRLNEIMKELQS